MIGHDDPGPQLIPVSVTEPQGFLAPGGDLRAPQMARAPAAIQISFEFQPALTVAFDRQKPLPLRTQSGRKGIRQVKSNELRQPRLVTMRQVTALVPATKPEPGWFQGQR